MKSTSHYALAAAAGLFMGALAITPAKAADLGGDCCADLEERVAELEATTVRKGNRVVSVQLYGQVNRALMYWDDGVEEDLYHVDNDHSSSRLGVRGTGALKPGWTVGYDVQWNVQVADTSAISQDDFQANDSNKPVAWDIRRAEVYFDSARFGRLTIGQGSSASDGSSEVDLAFANYSSDTLYNTSFFVRGEADIDAEFTWFDFGWNLDGQGRQNRIRYDSPSLYGFILSASAGADDYWDVALRFSKEWNSVRFAAAIAYSETEDDTGRVKSTATVAPDTETISGSASIQHTPSGLFLTGAAATRDTDAFTESVEGCPTQDSAGNLEDFEQLSGTCQKFTLGGFNEASSLLFDEEYDRDSQDAWFYWLKGGVSRDFTGYGATTIFGAYGQYEDFAEGELFGLVIDTDESPSVGSTNAQLEEGYRVTSSQVTRYAFGINQTFASAATDIYAHFEYNEADIDAIAIEDDGEGNIVDADGASSGGIDTEDWWTVVVGSKISF